MSQSHSNYDKLTRTLHWLVALGIFIMIGIGITFNYIAHSGSLFETLMYLHKSIGMTILFLMLIRVFWRMTFMRIPPYDPPLSKMNITIAHIAHMLIYTGIFVMLSSGWLGSSMLGYPVPFWFVNLALPVAGHPDIAGWMFEIHGIAIWVLGGIIILHILGAIMHNLKKEKVIQRML